MTEDQDSDDLPEETGIRTPILWRRDRLPNIFGRWGATLGIIPGSELSPVYFGAYREMISRVISTIGGAEFSGAAFHIGRGIFVSAGHNFYRRLNGASALSPYSRARLATASSGDFEILSKVRTYPSFRTRGLTHLDIALFHVPQMAQAAAMSCEPGDHIKSGRGTVYGFPMGGAFDGASLCSAGGDFVFADEYFYNHKASTLTGVSGGPFVDAAFGAPIATAVHIADLGTQTNQALALWPNFVSFAERCVAAGRMVRA